MGQVELSGSSSPETLSWVVVVPDVQVTHLGAFWRCQANDQFCRNPDGDTQASRTQVGFDFCLFGFCNAVVEVLVGVDFGSWLGKIGRFGLGQAVGGAVGPLGADGVVCHEKEEVGGGNVEVKSWRRCGMWSGSAMCPSRSFERV